jgi:alcohol dehydrogenase (NADP+)
LVGHSSLSYRTLGNSARHLVKQENEPILLENEVIKAIAQKHQSTTAQILIQWAIERETVVIPKSVSPERIKENFEAQNISLDTEDMSKIKTINRNYRYVDASFFALPNSSYTVKSIWD